MTKEQKTANAIIHNAKRIKNAKGKEKELTDILLELEFISQLVYSDVRLADIMLHNLTAGLTSDMYDATVYIRDAVMGHIVWGQECEMRKNNKAKH